MIEFVVIFASVLVLFSALPSTFAYTHLHFSSGVGSDESGRSFISGVTVSEGGPDPRVSEPLLISYNATILKDVLLFSEMNLDGIEIQTCHYQSPSLSSTLTLNGEEIDLTDYKKGAFLIMEKQAWFHACGIDDFPNTVDGSDDMLFLKMEGDGVQSSGCTSACVELQLSFASGGEVVPVVKLSVSEIQSARHVTQDSARTQKSISSGAAALIGHSHVDEIKTIPLDNGQAAKNVFDFDSISLTVETSLSATITDFQITRFARLAVEWKQTFSASASVALEVVNEKTWSGSGLITKFGIPSFGFSARIPFIGRITVGAVVQAEWKLSIDASASFTASYAIGYEQVDWVDAQLFPPKYAVRNMNANMGNGGNGKITVGPEASASIEISGFVGVRLSVGLEILLGGNGIAGNVGPTLGLELSVVGKVPCFEPFNGPGFVFGICQTFHLIRAQLKFVAKDLDAQIVVAKKVVESVVVIQLNFERPIGTWCFVSCSTSTPTPSSTPSPTPSPTLSSSKSPSVSISPSVSMTLSVTASPSISTPPSGPPPSENPELTPFETPDLFEILFLNVLPTPQA